MASPYGTVIAPCDSRVGRYPNRPKNARYCTIAKLRDTTSPTLRRRKPSSSASTPPTRAIIRNAPIRRTGPMKPPTAASNLTSPPPSMPSVNGGSESSSANPAPSTPSTSALTPSTPRNSSATPSPATVNTFGIRRQRRSNHTPRLSSVASAALAITDLVQCSDTLALRGAGAGSTVRPLAGVAPPRGRALLLRHVRGCVRGPQPVRDWSEHVAGAVPHEYQGRAQTDRHQRDNQRVLDHALPGVIAPEPLPEVLHRFLPGPRPE